MADIITNFFLTPVANRIAATQTKKLAPSLLELGSDNLTRNPQREAVARLFSPASSSALIARLDSLLTASLANQPATTTATNNSSSLKNNLKSTTGLKTANDTSSLAQELFVRRETGAELRLKELLQTSGTSSNAAQVPATTGDTPPAAPAVPAITRNAGLRVNEGGSALLDSSRLRAGDADSRPQDIVFTVADDGPRHGQLELVSKPGEAVTTFTQRDLDIGRIKYVNDGSESTSDSFKFTVSDGTSTRTGSFAISIAAVNDTPETAVNTGLTVDEGGSAAITAVQLSALDADGLSDTTVFEVTSAPAHGRLEINGSAVISFTQADLQAGRLSYVNDGSEHTAVSFSFRIGGGSATSPVATFSIGVNPVDDAPVASVNTGLTLDEGGSAIITPAQLSVSDVDTAPENITYTVTNAPANGRLEFGDNAGTSITSFTQADINAGRVRYVNDGSETTSDSFTFTASDATTGLPAATFNFTISPVDDAPVLANNTGAALNEGGTATITSAQLRLTDVDTTSQNLSFTVTSAPANGSLELATNPGTSVTTFTQADIDAGRLRFVHNGSETTSDSFSFTARDGTTTLGTANFSFTVAPVNDAPAIVNNGATVTEGGSRVITTANLRATDPDSASSSLVYTVSTAPTTGRLENTNNAGVAITSFTQDDLAAGRIRFVHNGGEASTSTFGFSLSDGQATVANNTFTFNVTPVNDAPVQVTNTGAAVTRRTSTIITSSQLRATDVDNSAANLTYSISRAPARGRLELTTNPGVSITSFTQADIDAGHVRYVHTSTRTTDDTFRFRVSDGTAQLAQQTFTIDVR